MLRATCRLPCRVMRGVKAGRGMEDPITADKWNLPTDLVTAVFKQFSNPNKQTDEHITGQKRNQSRDHLYHAV